MTWSYEPTRDLVAAVTNDVHSVYLYTYDLLGRRVSKNDERYAYNARNELTSADDLSYAYDDIGNRIVAEGKTYTANNLNQYTKIDDFVPQYDADGNQTLIRTSTGVWRVTYNAGNRPVRWQSGDTVITMAFDRMGRRVEMRTVTPTSDLLQRFVYKDFLCIQQFRGPDNAPYQTYVWDPTEPIATRPLLLTDATGAHSLTYAYSPYGTPSSSPPPPSPLTTPSDFPRKSKLFLVSRLVGFCETFMVPRESDFSCPFWFARVAPRGRDVLLLSLFMIGFHKVRKHIIHFPD